MALLVHLVLLTCLVQGSLTFDGLKNHIDYLHHRFRQNIKKSILGRGERLTHRLRGVSPSKKHACTGGADPSKLKKLDYLKAFNSNGCSPLMVIPGDLGSKMIATIDCPVFKAQHPLAFKKCGWSQCGTPGSKGTPQSEYLLWIPTLTSPMSLFRPLDYTANICFTTIFALDIIQNKKTKILSYKSRAGVTVYPVGDTKSTAKNSHCGFDGMCNLLPTEKLIELGMQYFNNMRIFLEKIGYVHGLTMQGLPYDFRLSFTTNSINTKFGRVVSDLNQITGKRVTIIAHSMGNVNTYHNLLKMS